MARTSKTPDMVYYFEQGTLNDVQIGERVGCSKQHVGKERKKWLQNKPATTTATSASVADVKITKREAVEKFLDGDSGPLEILVEGLPVKDVATVYRTLEAARWERRKSEKLEQDDTKIDLAVFDACVRRASQSLGEYFQLGEDEYLSEQALKWAVAFVNYVQSNYPDETARLRRAGYKW